MKISSLTINNWMIFKGENSIKFPTDTHANVLVIFGENTHGKTTLINSIRWGLYGVVEDRQKEIISDKNLINHDAYAEGERKLSVVMDFEADGNEYNLKRELDLDNKKGSKATLRKNARVIDGGKISDEIDYLIPEQLSKFFLFDGELLNEYEELVRKQDSPLSKQLKSSIEQNLGLPILNRSEELLGDLQREFQKLLAKEAQKNNASKHQGDILNEYLDKRGLKKIELENFNKKILENRDTIEKLTKELEQSKLVLKDVVIRDEIIKRIEGLRSSISKEQDKLKDITKKLWRYPLQKALTPKIKILDNQIQKLSNTQTGKIQAKFEHDNYIKTLNEGKCESCGYEISDEKRKELQDKIEKMEPKIEELEKIDEELTEKKLLHKTLLPILEIDFSIDTMEIINTNIDNHKMSLIKANSELSEVKERLKLHDEANLSAKRRECDARLKELGELENKTLHITDEIETLDKNIENLRNSMKTSSGSEYEIYEKQENLTKNLTKCFRAATEKYRDHKRQQISERATDTFRNLTTEDEFERLEINENYGLKLIVKGKEFSTGAGAEQIVALSLIESLNHLGRRKGPMMMDTPSGRLDMTHRGKIMEYLPTVVTQLGIFVHSGELSEDAIYFDKSLIGKKYRIKRIGTQQSKLEEI